jgi:catechol-2,3-dioxygenase
MTIMVAAHLPEPTSVISPYKVSHHGVRTSRIPVLRDWYITVLGLAVVFESDDLCLLTFDNEHHADAAHTSHTETNGIEHAALTYASLGELVSTYERLKELDIKPYSCVNHGPTTSIYSDPDSNYLVDPKIRKIDKPQQWITKEYSRNRVTDKHRLAPETIRERTRNNCHNHEAPC